jgi:hypothetical protein
MPCATDHEVPLLLCAIYPEVDFLPCATDLGVALLPCAIYPEVARLLPECTGVVLLLGATFFE